MDRSHLRQEQEQERELLVEEEGRTTMGAAEVGVLEGRGRMDMGVSGVGVDREGGRRLMVVDLVGTYRVGSGDEAREYRMGLAVDGMVMVGEEGERIDGVLMAFGDFAHLLVKKKSRTPVMIRTLQSE